MYAIVYSLYRAIKTLCVIMLCIMAITNCTSIENNPMASLPRGTLTGCGPSLQLDIVSTEVLRQRGLMGIATLPDNYGMLFVFKDGIQPAFWMKDTQIPLEVVFMSKSGVILAITAMKPFSEIVHQSPEIAPYALELPHGWMATHGVTIGQRCEIQLPDSLVVE